MKKLLIFAASILLAKNVLMLKPIDPNYNSSTFIDEENKIITYVQKVNIIDTNKTKKAFNMAKNSLCKNEEIRNELKNGYVIDFIYLGKKNSLLIRITECD